MKSQNNLAFLILIGGKSVRFGIEKAAIELLGKPLFLHQIETLLKLDKKIFLVAHSDDQISKYKKLINFPQEVKFILDDREIFNHPNIYRPMLGIYSGLKELIKLGLQKAFILSCDMPLIKLELIKLMINRSVGNDCCIPRWNNGFLEPLFAIYPVEKGFERAKNILINENYGIHNLIDDNWKINYISVEKLFQPIDPNLVSLININGPIDLTKLMKYIVKES
jgi:molybdopterin-guanine dinucleotide biosynthesis protein A